MKIKKRISKEAAKQMNMIMVWMAVRLAEKTTNSVTNNDSSSVLYFRILHMNPRNHGLRIITAEF